jgi:hypothetical protein
VGTQYAARRARPAHRQTATAPRGGGLPDQDDWRGARCVPSDADQLEEAALHAALATIDSMQPGYAIKLLRLQNEMIQTFDRYQRGNKQTVEVRHVHIHSGGQGVVGIINPPEDRDVGVGD